MTNDELERVMNFIIERQERVAEQQEAFAEQQEAFAEQMAQSNERMTRLEQSAEKQQRLAEYQQGLLTSVIETQDRNGEDIRNLTTHVNRIAEAVAFLIERDGANGGKGQA